VEPIKIYRVKSWRDFPPDADGTPQDSSVRAMAYPRKEWCML